MVDKGACEIRVTTDEQVFRDHGSFFCASGFEVIDWQVNRYRRGASELLWKLDVDPNLWGSRGFSQRWNEPGILPLAKLGQLVDSHIKGENTNREYRLWQALLHLTRFGGSLQENTVRTLYGLRADELEVSSRRFMLEEMFRRHEHPVDLLERAPVAEKGYLWKAVHERLSAKVRRWKRNLTVVMSGAGPRASIRKRRQKPQLQILVSEPYPDFPTAPY
jgi:hypothetical protein